MNGPFTNDGNPWDLDLQLGGGQPPQFSIGSGDRPKLTAEEAKLVQTMATGAMVTSAIVWLSIFGLVGYGIYRATK